MKKALMRNEQAQQRYSEILKAAKGLFAAKGYHSTSTRSINQAVGVADGLLYHYFPQGKQQILDVIIQNEVIAKLEELLENVQRIPEDLPLAEFLQVVGETALKNLIERDQEAMTVFFREQQNVSAAYQQTIEAYFSHIMEFLINRFRQYIAQGEMKPLQPKLAAMQFLGAYQHFIMMKLLGTWKTIDVDEQNYVGLLVEHLLLCWKS